jgi:hypothetical protein
LLVLVVLIAACQRKSQVPTCDAMADHVLELFAPIDDFSREVRDVFSRRCKADGWSDEMRRCVGGTTAVVEPKNCKLKLLPEQAKKLEDEITRAEARQSKRILPESCKHYEQVLSHVLECEKLPKDVRDTLAAKFAEAKGQWASMEDKSELAGICGSGISSLKTAAIGADCPNAKNW